MSCVPDQRRSTDLARIQRGVSLIEVLVAVFVLAVGMLGTASLQLTSKRSNMEAKDRAIATMVAMGFIERMRMNSRELAVYTNDAVGRVLDGSTMAAVDCGVNCTAAEMAALDLYLFEQDLMGNAEQVGGTAVGGVNTPRACIDGPGGGSGTYTIAIAWRGLTRLSNPSVNDCGEGAGVYDTSDGTEADVYRRVLVVETYISVPL